MNNFINYCKNFSGANFISHVQKGTFCLLDCSGHSNNMLLLFLWNDGSDRIRQKPENIYFSSVSLFFSIQCRHKCPPFSFWLPFTVLSCCAFSCSTAVFSNMQQKNKRHQVVGVKQSHLIYTTSDGCSAINHIWEENRKSNCDGNEVGDCEFLWGDRSISLTNPLSSPWPSTCVCTKVKKKVLFFICAFLRTVNKDCVPEML